MPYQGNTVTEPDQPLTEAEIAAVEAIIGEKLPSTLRRHFLEFNGGQLDRWHFTTADDETFQFHEFLSMGPDGSGTFEQAFDVARKDPGFLPADLIPFAIDPGGAFFCLRRSDEHVVFFNSEDADNLDLAMRDLAPSLRNFIEGMS